MHPDKWNELQSQRQQRIDDLRARQAAAVKREKKIAVGVVSVVVFWVLFLLMVLTVATIGLFKLVF